MAVDISAWLEAMGLDKYAGLFAKRETDLSRLPAHRVSACHSSQDRTPLSHPQRQLQRRKDLHLFTRHDTNAHVVPADELPRADFAGFAQFDVPSTETPPTATSSPGFCAQLRHSLKSAIEDDAAPIHLQEWKRRSFVESPVFRPTLRMDLELCSWKEPWPGSP